jgi:hypothetical protein
LKKTKNKHHKQLLFFMFMNHLFYLKFHLILLRIRPIRDIFLHHSFDKVDKINFDQYSFEILIVLALFYPLKPYFSIYFSYLHLYYFFTYFLYHYYFFIDFSYHCYYFFIYFLNHYSYYFFIYFFHQWCFFFIYFSNYCYFFNHYFFNYYFFIYYFFIYYFFIYFLFHHSHFSFLSKDYLVLSFHFP